MTARPRRRTARLAMHQADLAAAVGGTWSEKKEEDAGKHRAEDVPRECEEQPEALRESVAITTENSSMSSPRKSATSLFG